MKLYFRSKRYPIAWKLEDRLFELSLGEDGQMYYWLCSTDSDICFSYLRHGKIVIGWAAIIVYDNNAAEIGVFVDEKYRERGFAKLLLDHVLKGFNRTINKERQCSIVAYDCKAERLLLQAIEKNGLKGERDYW